MSYGEIPTTSSRILTRTALFQPIVASKIRILVEQAAPEVLAKLEILGLPNKKAYAMNPILSQITYETGK